MTDETRLLLRYVDREMSALEAERFRARLAQSPELSRELDDMRRLGALLRRWSAAVEPGAHGLLEPTLERVRRGERRRSRLSWLSYGLVVLPMLSLRASASLEPPSTPSLAHAVVGAAIERIEAAPRGARVFVVGSAATPVVWLSDDDRDDDEQSERDPG